LFAVILLHRTTHTLRTTVAAIIIASFVVVVIVAIAVTLVLFLTTCSRFRFGIGIEAFALFAVILLHRTTHTLRTTVAAIIIASFVVVVIVTVAVALVFVFFTGSKHLVELTFASSTVAAIFLFHRLTLERLL